MFQVSIYVEALRSRPSLVFWLATLTQAALWFLVPVLFYASPPSGLAQVLALGHEFPLDGRFGPPLAYWIAEIAFRLAGLPGVYALSQICLIATYWCVFALGRAIVGETHAAMAVLLMAGVSVFTLPTPNFGPSMLAMALWAASLLFYWRAVFDGQRRYWYAVGVSAALLLLTSYAALVLLSAMILFTAFSRRASAMAGLAEAWVAAGLFITGLFAYSLWLERADINLMPALARLRDTQMAIGNTSKWLWLLAGLILAHAGFVVLLVLAQFWPVTGGGRAPIISREPVTRGAAIYVKIFALVPALLFTIALVALAAPSRPGVYFGDDIAGSRSITADDIRKKGAIVVWPAPETTPEPPPKIRALFPDLVTEVPQTFARPVRGRLPPLRIGWGMVRPAREAAMLSDPHR